MSIHAPNSMPSKAGSSALAFLFLAAIALAFLGAGLILGTEPRLVLERSEGRTFRVTVSNHFAGRQFYSKTIEGVESVVVDNAVRDGRRDSERVNRKRRRDLHLDLFNASGARIGWDRESDRRGIEDFMRGQEPRLALADSPSLWRMGLAWFLVVFSGLTFVGAIRSSFFQKRGLPL